MTVVKRLRHLYQGQCRRHTLPSTVPGAREYAVRATESQRLRGAPPPGFTLSRGGYTGSKAPSFPISQKKVPGQPVEAALDLGTGPRSY